MPQDLDRFRFWVHDYQPLPATIAVQMVCAMGVAAGLIVAFPFSTSLSDADLWTVLLLVLCGAVVAFLLVFLRTASYVRPARWMIVTGFAAGFVVGFVGQLVFAPG